MSQPIKVFFQGLGLPHTYTLAVATELARYRDLRVTLGDQTLYTFLKVMQHRRLLRLDTTSLPVVSEKGRGISKRAAGVLLPPCRKLLSRFDILHLNHLDPSYEKAIRSIDKPKIFTFHAQNFTVEEDIERIRYVQRTLADMNVVTAPSRFMAKVLRDKAGCHPVVIYNGVDTNLFNPEVRQLCPCRTLLGIPEGRTVVLWNGRLAWEKDLGTLLDAIPRVVEQVPSAFFLLKGRRPRFSRARKHFQDHVNRTIKNRNLRAYVKLVHTYVPYEKVPIYYGAADVFVHTSRLEAFGLVVAEAMASRLPVVAARASAIPEVLGKTGMFYKTGDSDALAKAVVSLLENRALRENLGRRAQERAGEMFAWNKTAAKFHSIYVSLLGKN